MKAVVYNLGLGCVAVLCILSVFGAFWGAEKAQAFFNSIPLAVFWAILLFLLIAAIIAFKNIQSQPMLFLMHLSCIFILFGGLCGSHAGHRAINAKTPHLIYKGYIKLYPGQKSNQVYVEADDRIAALDFEVGLQDFQILYYDKPITMLHIQSDLGSWQILAAKGTDYGLSEQAGRVRVLEAFDNLKIRLENGKPVASEGPAVESNPAWLLEFIAPNGQVTQQFVFEKFSGHATPGGRFLVSVHKQGAMVKDYISDLIILKDGQPVAQRKIEVNRPLHYAGYDFYQSSYGQDELGTYSILQMVSNRGVSTVIAGYTLLAIGLFVHFGLKIIRHRTKVNAA
jgi:hypothetical protein